MEGTIKYLLFSEEDMNNRNIIVFEGPDCCGKTTQIKKLAKKLKNCIVIHSPRKSTGTTDCFNLTNTTIYNQEFMNSIFSSERPYDIIHKLKTALLENVTMNHTDRLCILEIIYWTYLDPSGKNLFDIKCKEDYIFVYDGEIIDVDRNPRWVDAKLKALFYRFKTNPEECYFILDRFYISGFIYNYYIPLKLINKYKYENIDNKNNINIKRDFKTLAKDIKELVVYSNETVKNIIVSYNLDLLTFIFRSSEVIKEILSDNREYDSYDKNTFIQCVSSDYYDNKVFTDESSKIVIVDTDTIYKNNGELDDVEKFIYESVTNYYKK